MNRENFARESPEEKLQSKEIQILTSLLPIEFCHFMLDEIVEGMYAVNREGTLRYANLALAHILGYESANDIVGHDIKSFLQQDSYDTILKQFYDAIAAGVEPIYITAKIKGPDGDPLWLEIRLKNVVAVNGETLCSGIIRDISAQRKNAEVLKANEAYYQTLVEISPDAIWVIHPDGTIEQANTKAMQLFGYTDNPAENRQSIYDHVFPEEHDRIRSDIHNVILQGEIHDAEYKLQRQDGSFFWGSITAKHIPSPEEGQKTILVLTRDITERKITEDHLRSLSVTDDLSGLYNRRGFILASEQELKHALRRKEGLVLLFFDIDNLKMINDTFGHLEGDKAIKEAAQALRATFRESDIIARWGGDEFVVLALDVPQGRTPILLQRLDQIMQEYNQKQTTARKISFSSGTAYCDPEMPLGLAEMERMADEMMYKNKQEKKLQLMMFTNDRGEIEAQFLFIGVIKTKAEYVMFYILMPFKKEDKNMTVTSDYSILTYLLERYRIICNDWRFLVINDTTIREFII